MAALESEKAMAALPCFFFFFLKERDEVSERERNKFFSFPFFDLFHAPPPKSAKEKEDKRLSHHVVQVDEERVLDRDVLPSDLDGPAGELHLLDVLDARKVPGKRRERGSRVHYQGFRAAARDVGGE